MVRSGSDALSLPSLNVTIQVSQDKLAQARAMDGRYLLGTNGFDLSVLEVGFGHDLVLGDHGHG